MDVFVRILFLISCIFFGISLSTVVIDMSRARFNPRYHGIDSKLEPLVNDYLSLAKDHGIKFTHTVTMGFMNIDDGDVIGRTHYGKFFREIDISDDYWNGASNTSKMTLIFHELGHAMCYRDHDYGDGKKYGDDYDNFADRKKGSAASNGKFEDRCPLSIMYPSILPDWCVRKHYPEYTDEMFQRCVPY